jgi:MOSC domain-containing protein YiiM
VTLPDQSEPPALSPAAGTILAVCRSGTHPVNKVPQERIHLVAGVGVEGDRHAGGTPEQRAYEAAHKLYRSLGFSGRDPQEVRHPKLRQVHLVHVELYDELAEAGFVLAPGNLGENVTTRGLDLLGLPTGARLRLGDEAIVEVTGLRAPCRKLNDLRPGLMAATLGRDGQGRLVRKSGIMSVVVAAGDVRPGDPVRVDELPDERRPLVPV